MTLAPRFFHFLLFTLLISLSATADSVVSRPVGYIRIDLAPNEQRLTSLPFDPLNDSLCGAAMSTSLSGMASGARRGRRASKESEPVGGG